MSDVLTLIKLRYSYPLNVHDLPKEVLETVHFQAFGYEYLSGPFAFTIEDSLTRFTDLQELQAGLEKALIEYYDNL